MRVNKTENLEMLINSVKEIKEKDVNCFLLRFTSLYMDGSYTGYNDYQLNIRKYNKCKNDESRLKFCYSMLVHMCKIEYGSWVTNIVIQTVLDGNLDEDEKQWFESELLERAYDTLSQDNM